MARPHSLFEFLQQRGASDLHLAAGLEPRVRQHGTLEDVPGWSRLSSEELLEMMHEIAPPRQWKEYEETGDADFAYGLAGVARFRANYLPQENGPAAVFRMIPEDIVPPEKLDLPPAIAALADMQSGRGPVTGPADSGK